MPLKTFWWGASPWRQQSGKIPARRFYESSQNSARKTGKKTWRGWVWRRALAKTARGCNPLWRKERFALLLLDCFTSPLVCVYYGEESTKQDMHVLQEAQVQGHGVHFCELLVNHLYLGWASRWAHLWNSPFTVNTTDWALNWSRSVRFNKHLWWVLWTVPLNTHSVKNAW